MVLLVLRALSPERIKSCDEVLEVKDCLVEADDERKVALRGLCEGRQLEVRQTEARRLFCQGRRTHLGELAIE